MWIITEYLCGLVQQTSGDKSPVDRLLVEGAVCRLPRPRSAIITRESVTAGTTTTTESITSPSLERQGDVEVQNAPGARSWGFILYYWDPYFVIHDPLSKIRVSFTFRVIFIGCGFRVNVSSEFFCRFSWFGSWWITAHQIVGLLNIGLLYLDLIIKSHG